MIPGSRNPMWGEEFDFSVDELPVQVSWLHIEILSSLLGSGEMFWLDWSEASIFIRKVRDV